MKKKIKNAAKQKVAGKLPSSPQKMPPAGPKVPNEADATMRNMMKSNGKKSKLY